MHVSVLIPSRGRPRRLCDTIESLAQRTADVSGVEVLVRCDNDDPYLDEYHRVVNALSIEPATPTVRLLVGPHLDGWQSNHEFFNELAADARGTWLFMYNDDAEVTTQHWDARIPLVSDPCVLSPECRRPQKPGQFSWQAGDGRRMSNCFPIMHRSVYQALGAFSRHRHADCYLEWLVAPLGLQRPIEITIMHRPTSSVIGGGSKWFKEFHAAPTDALLRQDTAALTRLLENADNEHV